MFRFIFTTLINVREQDLDKAILLYCEALFQFDITAKKEAIIKKFLEVINLDFS